MNEVPTVQETFDAYIESGGSPAYFAPLLALIGHLPISEMNQERIDYLASVICANVTVSTCIRQVYVPLSAILKFAAARCWCGYFRIKRPRGEQSTPAAVPSQQDIQEFFNRAGPHLKHIALFIRFTGLSLHDTLRMEWPQVDLANRRVQVRTKWGVRERDLPPQVIEMLARLKRREEGRVFRGPSGAPYMVSALRGGAIRTACRGASERAGVPKIGTRELRRLWKVEQSIRDEKRHAS
jgi:integrase